MKFALLFALLAVAAEAYSPIGTPKKSFDFKNAAMGAFAAATIASGALTMPAEAIDTQLGFGGAPTVILSAKVVKQGMYQDYEIDLEPQTIDDAASTFKSAKETKSKKGKYTALLSILIVGSFIIPMAQYFWYVRDDDSSDRFFAEPEPPKKKAAGGWGKKKAAAPAPEPPKKKGWFNKD